MGLDMEGYGARMLSKMGWKPGTGLGARRDGAINPVVLKKVKENRGIGAKREKKTNDMWWLNAFEDALKRQKDAIEGESEGEVENVNGESLFEKCEGRRCRPHGMAKLRRLEEQDQGVPGDVNEVVGAGLDGRKGNVVKSKKNKKKRGKSSKKGKVKDKKGRIEKLKR